MNLVPIVDQHNKRLEDLKTDSSVFEYPLRKDLIHLVLRWQAANARDKSGLTQKAKNRSEVAGAHRKAWGQKESGRARQGDMKAPHCYGGGVAFGINPRHYAFKLPKQLRAYALASLLSYKIKNLGICILSDGIFDGLDFSKTKNVNEIKSTFNNKRIVFLHDSVDPVKMRGCRLADFVEVLNVNAINIKSLCRAFIVCIDKNVFYKLQSLLENRLRRNK